MPCRLCSSTDSLTLHTFDQWMDSAKKSDDERSLMANILSRDSELNFGTIVRCKKCNFLSVKDIPNESALNSFYQEYYANAKYESKEAKKIKRSKRRILRLSKHVKEGTFLDVGCNLGFSVEAASRLGFDASGIDVDNTAIGKARASFPNATFHCEKVEAFAQKSEKFNLVFCTEVIEHLGNFKDFVVAISSLVDKGGVLYLTTPDEGHFRRPKNLMDWTEIKPPEHLQWFQKAHIKSLFEAQGLKVGFQLNLKPGIRMVAKR